MSDEEFISSDPEYEFLQTVTGINNAFNDAAQGGPPLKKADLAVFREALEEAFFDYRSSVGEFKVALDARIQYDQTSGRIDGYLKAIDSFGLEP